MEFIGFQTGNNTRILINPDRLKAARALLDYDSQDFSQSEALSNPHDSTVFQEANFHSLSGNSAALSNVANLLEANSQASMSPDLKLDQSKQEINSRSLKTEPADVYTNRISNTHHHSSLGGFNTLKMKTGLNSMKDDIVEGNLGQDKKYLTDDEDSILIKTFKEGTASFNIEGGGAFVGFQTADHKKITLDPEKLKRAAALFGDESQDMSSLDVGEFCSFHHGDRKAIPVNQEGSSKDESLLDDRSLAASNIAQHLSAVDISHQAKHDQDMHISSHEKDTDKPKITHTSFGFRTAGDKPIPLNPESLKRAQFILADSQTDLSITTEQPQLQPLGFSACNNTSILGNSDKLQRVLSMFELDSQQDYNIPQEAISYTTGKDATIPERSDSFNSHQFISDQRFEKSDSRPLKDSGKPIGFRTGNNSSIAIDPERLKIAQALFDKDSQDASFDENIGFCTGNRNPISINPDSYKKAQALFDAESQGPIQPSKPAPFMNIGFSTGNNNAIPVKPESLQRVQSLLDSQTSQNTLPHSALNPRSINIPIEKQPALPSKYKLPNQILDSVCPPKPNHKPLPTKCPSLLNSIQTSRSSQIHKNSIIANTAYEYKHTRRELSCNSGLRPHISALPKFITPPIKRKAECNAPTRKVKCNPKVSSYLISKKSSTSLLQLNDQKPLSGFIMSTGAYLSLKDCASYIFLCTCSTLCLCSGSKKIGYTEIHAYLDKEKLRCTEDWVQNHYRFSVWKYASYERRLSSCSGIFSISRILEDLKRRWYIENEKGMRSIIKRIQDGDELPTRRMVLCIGEVNYNRLELTDGWYSIHAIVPTNDDHILKQFQSGTKVNICFMTREGEGYKIDLNAFRRAEWHEKLGAVKNAIPFLVNLKSLCQTGGMVPCVDVIVVKRYAMSYHVKADEKEYRFNESSFEEFNDTYRAKDPEEKPYVRTHFTIMVKDALMIHNNKYDESAYVTIYENASEMFEELKPNNRIKLYILKPAKKAKNNKLHLNYMRSSRFKHLGRVDEDYSIWNPFYHEHLEYDAECDILGVILQILKNTDGTVYMLILGTSELQKITITFHSATFHSAILRKLKPSYFQYLHILSITNLKVLHRKHSLITTQDTEFFNRSPPPHFKLKIQEISSLYHSQPHSFMDLVHHTSCDENGCVCTLIRV
jgi:hypothetical protein